MEQKFSNLGRVMEAANHVKNSAMETRDHFKNGASPKSQTSRKKFLVSFLAVIIIYCTSVEAQKITPTIAREMARWCNYNVSTNAFCNEVVVDKFGAGSIRDLDDFYESLPNRLDIAENFICEAYVRMGSDFFYQNVKDFFTSSEIDIIDKICEPKLAQSQEKYRQEAEKKNQEAKKMALGTISTCEDFVDGVAWVGFDIKYLLGEERNDYWSGYRVYGLINTQGEFVIEPQYVVYNQYRYEPAPTFVDGFALVEPFNNDKSRKLIFVDQKGNNVFNKTFVWATEFSEGYAAVLDDSRKFGCIDKTGNFIFELNRDYTGVGLFREGLARVCLKKEKWGYIDNTGKEVIYPQFSTADDFSEGLAFVYNDNTKGGFINTKGEYAFTLKGYYGTESCNGGCDYTLIHGFRDGIAAIKGLRTDYAGFVKDTYYYYDKKGERTSNYHEGLTTYMEGKKYGFVNLQKNPKNKIIRTTITKPIFDEVGDFREGLAKVAIKSNWGFVDETGNVVINNDIMKPVLTQAPFESASDFSEGLAVVKTRGKYGYIDKNGNWVIQAIFAEAEPFKNGYARVKSLDRKGWNYIDKSGKILFSKFL